MSESPYLVCPSCKKQTLPQIKGGSAVACQNLKCQVIFNKKGKPLGKIIKNKPVYNSVKDIPMRSYRLENITATPIFEVEMSFQITNAETGEILNEGDIIPKHVLVKLSY